MEAKIVYNFDSLERTISKFRNSGNMNSRSLPDVQRELNKFFKGSKCKEVLFTKNIDKLFFGMTTYAVFDYGDDIISGDEPLRIECYMVEIDSKLIDIGLTTKEITAVLLHEVGHLVNDSTPVDQVRTAVDAYLATNNITVDIEAVRNNRALFDFAVMDSIRKANSLFTRNDEEILADEFVFRCGYGNELESAFRKIKGSTLNVNENVPNKFLTLYWALRIYTDLGVHRLSAIKTLNKIESMSGSVLEKREAKRVYKGLKHEINLTEAMLIKESDKGLIHKLRRGGLKAIEEDVYEYQMRIRNVDDENDAIVLMRQLNARMSVLDDYLYNSDKIEESERKRWERVLAKYDVLREELSKKTVYNHKQYGIWLDYNYANAMQGGSDPYYR